MYTKCTFLFLSWGKIQKKKKKQLMAYEVKGTEMDIKIKKKLF